jgi:pimeloyl-ACP methyl ester carboxylesterase
MNDERDNASTRELAPERTIEEVKAEALARAERGNYPMIGLKPADVSAAFERIHTRDRDEWAAGFCAVAQTYVERARAASSKEEADANYVTAWRLFHFGQWPVPNSEGKKAAYQKAVDAYVAHASLLDPPMERIEIPFADGPIVAYLRLPRSPRPAPLVMVISGLDSRKETVAETYNQIIPHGVGYLAVDGPGTGQSPFKVGKDSERMFSRVLDYLQDRPDVDSTRIVLHGVSFGAYWAAKLAIVERARILGAVAQSPPVHEFFTKEYLYSNTLGNREYLFDLTPAFIHVIDGASSVDDLARILPGLSLRDQGLLNNPTAPMFIVTGARDSQVPMSDVYALLETGDAPKEAWINPAGGHLGRQPKGWTDPVIFREVIMPWELRMLERGAMTKA